MDGEHVNVLNIHNEVIVMRLCQHPNILPCFSCFCDATSLWIVTPFVEKGSLLGILQFLRSTDRIHPGEGFQVEYAM